MPTRRSAIVAVPPPAPMFPLRLTTPVPLHPIGRDIALMGTAEDGSFYYCKSDTGKPFVRATEALSTRLADDLGFPTADFRVIEDSDGNTYFGSFSHPSTADAEAVRSYFMRPAKNELGGTDPVKARLIARLFAFDMFIGNPDRISTNFVAIREVGFQRIAPIDFADASILRAPGAKLPGPNSNTVQWRRMLEHTHGFPHEAMLDMLNRISAIPVSFFEPVFERMPLGWIDPETQDGFREFWVGNARRERLAAIRAALTDGSPS